MDDSKPKRSNRTALALACATAIPALGALCVASAEGQHRVASPAPATTAAATDATGDTQPAQPIVLRDPGVAQDQPAIPAAHFELPLKPGEFEWHPEASLAGDIVILVSLPTQEMHVY